MNKNHIYGMLLAAVVSFPTFAMDKVDDEASLKDAIMAANADENINQIIFKKGAKIQLTAPVIYTGQQALLIEGNSAQINGEKAGKSEDFYDQVEKITTVRTQDGSLMFNTAANISINNLSVLKSHTRGIVVTIPVDAKGDDAILSLNNVSIVDSRLYGLHVDDNSNELDDGDIGADIGVHLQISHSTFVNNGTGAIDFDGIRVDERGIGDITAEIVDSVISHNGGDGIELDEGGYGDVKATMINVVLAENGFYNETDLDDAFDIDEAGPGNLEVQLTNVTLTNNKDQGLDFDEEGDGDANVLLYNVVATNTLKEAIKIDEEDAGSIHANLFTVKVNKGSDDGIQLTELGEGKVLVVLNDVKIKDNKKYGINVQQWVVEDEKMQIEPSGLMKLYNVMLSDNKKDDEIKSHAIVFEK